MRRKISVDHLKYPKRLRITIIKRKYRYVRESIRRFVSDTTVGQRFVVSYAIGKKPRRRVIFLMNLVNPLEGFGQNSGYEVWQKPKRFNRPWDRSSERRQTGKWLELRAWMAIWKCRRRW